MFPLKSDEIFRSHTRSPVLSPKSFVCATSFPSHACFSPVPSIVVRNCKNIRNRSVRCNSVWSSSSNVDRVSKPEYPVVSSFCVVSHRNIYRKRKLRKIVIRSSFVK